jgi:catechol 2,3-dioxygenase-like lactoylglutathione lyase family enzyme
MTARRCARGSDSAVRTIEARAGLFVLATYAVIFGINDARENAMEKNVGVLDHYNVSTRKLPETIRFYEEVLGFVNGPRPAFNFPGAWLYSAGHPVLHLNDISQTDRQQREDSGVIDHVAFGSRGFEAMKQHLSGKAVPYRVNQVPNSTRWQIFLRDPNNVEIELNFETKNELPAS